MCNEELTAELSLDKPTIAPNPVGLGENVTVRQIIANAGPNAATNVALKTNIPKGLSYNYNGSDKRCRVSVDGVVICGLGTLPTYASTFVTLSFTVTDLAPCGERVGYNAVISANQFDPILTNNKREGFIAIECDVDETKLIINTDSIPATHSPNADDVVMVNVNFQTIEGPIDIHEMYLLIQGQKNDGTTLGCGGKSRDSIAENIEDVEFRDTRTGQTIDAVLIGWDPATKSPGCARTSRNVSTTALYRLDDFVLRDTSRWAVRLDFIAKSVQQGDRFHAYLCTASEESTIGCDFNFFTQGSSAYNMDAVSLKTGKQVTSIQPGHTVQGLDQVVEVPILNVSVKNIGETGITKPNAKDILLLRFEEHAGVAEAIVFTKAIFGEGSDPRNLANIVNYSLWVDTEGDGKVDTLLEDGVSFDGSAAVTFSDLAGGGYIIPQKETVVFEIHGDVASDPVSDTIQLAFGTASSSPYIKAEELDTGAPLSGISTNGTCNEDICFIIVKTVESIIWTITE